MAANYIYLPPSQNLPCWNSSNPNSSRPIPMRRTLCFSSWGFRRLSSFAPSRHKGHPNRLIIWTTQVCCSHNEENFTIWKKQTNKQKENDMNHLHISNQWISFVFYCIENLLAHNFRTTGPNQVGFSAKCTSPNEHFNQIDSYVQLQTDFHVGLTST